MSQQPDPAREKVIRAARNIIAASEEPGLFIAQELFLEAVKTIAEVAAEKGLVINQPEMEHDINKLRSSAGSSI